MNNAAPQSTDVANKAIDMAVGSIRSIPLVGGFVPTDGIAETAKEKFQAFSEKDAAQKGKFSEWMQKLNKGFQWLWDALQGIVNNILSAIGLNPDKAAAAPQTPPATNNAPQSNEPTADVREQAQRAAEAARAQGAAPATGTTPNVPNATPPAKGAHK